MTLKDNSDLNKCVSKTQTSWAVKTVCNTVAPFFQEMATMHLMYKNRNCRRISGPSLLEVRVPSTLARYAADCVDRRGLCRHAVSVCLSVCLCRCVCLSRSWILSKRVRYRQTFSPSGRPIILFVSAPNWIAIFRRGPLTGASNARGMKKSRFSTNISLYLWTGERYDHSYYGRRIENRTQAFEWYQFEWSWVTSNWDSRSRIIKRQITQKNTRWSNNFNGGPIESRIWSIERRHVQWPWTTPKPVFKVTLYFDAEYLVNG